MNKDLKKVFELIEKLEDYDLELVISYAVRESKKKAVARNEEMLMGMKNSVEKGLNELN